MLGGDESLRLLHISDLHFGERARVVNRFDPDKGFLRSHVLSPGQELSFAHLTSHDPDAILGVSGIVGDLAKAGKIDSILITGDLATTGGRQDLQASAQFILGEGNGSVGDGESKATSLADYGLPIVLLPGNHDRLELLRLSPCGTNFDQAYSSHWPARQGVQHLHLNNGNFFLDVVCADLTLHSKQHATGGPWSPLGQGRVYPEILSALEELTATVSGERAQPPIWAVHFPPGFPEEDLDLELVYWRELLEAADRLSVPFVLCGHRHSPRNYLAEGFPRTRILCAGTASQCTIDEPNWALHLRTFSADHLGSLECQSIDYLWNSNIEDFWPGDKALD